MKRAGLGALAAAAVAAASITAAGGHAAAPAEAATGPAPNVIVVMLDDLDATTTPYWSALPRTAALVRDRGRVFTNAFSTTPTCCPARTSLLTGRYSHNTGVWNNGPTNAGGYPAFMRNGNESRTIALALQGAGYRTALFGKYLNGFGRDAPVPAGWDDWYVGVNETYYDGYGYELDENGTIVTYGRAPSDYLTDVLARKVTAFVDSTEAEDAKPFFALIAPTAPHWPLAPAPRHADHPWRTAPIPTTPNYMEPDVSDKPAWLQLALPVRDALQPTIVGDHRARMGSLLAVDDLVANLAAQLARNGELGNTYVVFTSDNGYNQGSHHLVSKLAPYEESIRVPLAVYGPGVQTGTDSRIVTLLDLAPTFAQIAGAPADTGADGRSIVPLLAGQTVPWRSDILLEYRNHMLGAVPFPQVFLLGAMLDMPSYTAVRTDRYVLIRWYDPAELNGIHEWELYDLQTDPYQLTNLIKTQQGLAAHAATVATLLERMTQLETCTGTGCS